MKAFFAVCTFDHLVRHLAVFFAKTTLEPGFVLMSPARIIRIARLVPFDELKRRNLSQLMRLPSFLLLVKQCEDPSPNTLLPILQSKFGSGESEPFAHFQRMKPRTTTTKNMNGSFLTWNLTIFFCPIPIKPATILTLNSQDWCKRPRVWSLRLAHSFLETWSWKHFYGHSPSSADSRRAVISYWGKNVH